MDICYSKLPLCKRSSLPVQRSQQLTQHSSLILQAGALLLVGASAALGSYFGYVVGSQQHILLGLVFAGAALGGEIVKPYAVSEIVSSLVAVEHHPSACVPHARGRLRRLQFHCGTELGGNHARRFGGDARSSSRCDPRRSGRSCTR